jgi:hypothetical protein
VDRHRFGYPQGQLGAPIPTKDHFIDRPGTPGHGGCRERRSGPVCPPGSPGPRDGTNGCGWSGTRPIPLRMHLDHVRVVRRWGTSKWISPLRARMAVRSSGVRLFRLWFGITAGSPLQGTLSASGPRRLRRVALAIVYQAAGPAVVEYGGRRPDGRARSGILRHRAPTPTIADAPSSRHRTRTKERTGRWPVRHADSLPSPCALRSDTPPLSRRVR